jgi:hypothetical protein
MPKYARRAKVAAVPGRDYRIAASGAGMPMLKCLLCEEHVPLKSNEGIVEELQRITRHLHIEIHACPESSCANRDKPAPDPEAYFSFGKTAAGSVRYRCKLCSRTFSISQRATIRQREARKNVPILISLLSKTPLSRIVDQHDISFQTLYDKLEFFNRQALAFCAKWEDKLPKIIEDTKRYIAVDRQDYVVNWTHRRDRRNVVLQAVGSADLESGYVFGMHLNFDGSLDVATIEKEAAACGDLVTPAPYRRFARLWLSPDYNRSVAESERLSAKKSKTGEPLVDAVQDRYAELEARSDVEAPEAMSTDSRLPGRGMQVKAEYTLYAHFYYLHTILAKAKKIRFFLDQESGIRAACLAAFEEEVIERRADAFFVRLGKELTIDQKRRVIKNSRERFAAVKDGYPGLSDYEVQVLMMKDAIAGSSHFGKWKDRWAVHPFPNHAEPEKAICYLTDLSDLDSEHKARLFLRASLHPVDRFFMSVRRRLNMLERPIGTSSRAGRTWYGYSAYQPANIEKLLNIFRTYYNFCLAGADNCTPAMRLGLAARVITPAELLGM